MTSGIAAISGYLPSVFSSGIFSFRRADKGLSATNPVVATMNLNIAGGQMTNAAKYTVDIARNSKGKIADSVVSAEKCIKEISDKSKLAKGTFSFLDFVGHYINPIITILEGIKVLFAKDKLDAGLTSGAGLGLMFTAEYCAKNFAGNAKIQTINGIRKVVPRDAWYKSIPVLKSAAQSIKKYCTNTKVLGKSLQWAPSAMKGLLLVGASITGYLVGSKLGHKMSDWIKSLQSDKKQEQAQYASMQYTKAA